MNVDFLRVRVYFWFEYCDVSKFLDHSPGTCKITRVIKGIFQFYSLRKYSFEPVVLFKIFTSHTNCNVNPIGVCILFIYLFYLVMFQESQTKIINFLVIDKISMYLSFLACNIHFCLFILNQSSFNYFFNTIITYLSNLARANISLNGSVQQLDNI